jgi:hypothetical protein
MLQFPSNLRLIRLVSGKSQTDFGSSFGATKAMIVSYEKAKAITAYYLDEPYSKKTIEKKMKSKLPEVQ